MVEARASDRRSRRPGSKPPAAVLKLGQFRSPHFACLLEEALKSLVPSI